MLDQSHQIREKSGTFAACFGDFPKSELQADRLRFVTAIPDGI